MKVIVFAKAGRTKVGAGLRVWQGVFCRLFPLEPEKEKSTGHVPIPCPISVTYDLYNGKYGEVSLKFGSDFLRRGTNSSYFCQVKVGAGLRVWRGVFFDYFH